MKTLTKAQLNKVIRLVPEEKRDLAKAYAQELLFASETLDRLKAEIRNDGATELFEQGTQRMQRVSPALKAYNDLVRQYVQTIRALADMMPKTSAKAPAVDLLDEFIRKRDND